MFCLVSHFLLFLEVYQLEGLRIALLLPIGATMIAISLSPSALQQTFGLAGRSLMLLSSFLYSVGFYLSAVYISQDLSLRKYFRGINKIELLDLLGNAQMESEIEKRVTKVLRDQQQTLSEQSGISISALGDDYDLKLYVNEVHRRSKKK